jgi:glycerol kinase
MASILAIDQGTSGTKAVVSGEAGEVLASVEEPVRPDYLPGDGVEVDPEELWRSVVTAGRRALDEAGVTVAAVALANQGETVLAWDPDTGRPLSRALVWQDGRSRTVTDRLAAEADDVARRTGLMLDPYFSAPKMRWIRDEWTTAGVVTTTDSWLVHRMCGEFVTDSSTASRSLLLGIDDVAWDERLLDVFGLGDERLPRIVASDEVVGTTTVFGPELPVAGLIVDQQAALLAQSCVEAGAAKCTYGTGAFLLANVGETAVRSTTGLTTSVAWSLRGRTAYCVDGQVYTAASAVRWLVDLGLLQSSHTVDEVAAEDAGGVLCVPTFAGAAAPWWRADATASFTGLTLASGRGHLVRAVLEGVAAQVALVLRSVGGDLGEPLSVLRVDGGLTRSQVLMQAQADLAQTPIELYPGGHATALGATAAARLALDPTLSVESAVGAWQQERVYTPSWSADRAATFLSAWERALTSGLSDREPE